MTRVGPPVLVLADHTNRMPPWLSLGASRSRVFWRHAWLRHSPSMTLTPSSPWTLPIAGYELLQITFAYPIDLVVYGGSGDSATVRFESRFDYVDGDQVHRLDASSQSWEELAIILPLRHDRIKHAAATEDDAHLRIEFASGRLLTAGPHPRYESWAVTVGDSQLIALPGGGVAHFAGPGIVGDAC